jgi:alpha-amylase/alpha-mannosidase (GH57 family)
MNAGRYLCIHGHFYQPPRENPWLEAIERQPSAYPYHDWNERITAECYAPNARARVLDGAERIAAILNNYARISFDFGPTLLSWLETQAPEVYRLVLEADRESAARFGGHGSAMAQVYNHIIMPLASERDRRTQVRWGIEDFRARFGRMPEGMWLAETAVDLATLDEMARQGIVFTVLAPRQAKAIRPVSGGAFVDVSGGRVDPSRAYRVSLPAGRSIAVFFYDGPVSQAVAFEGLLHRGEYFAERLSRAFSAKRTWPQLAHIATDGETYGHHHRHGEMALTLALRHIEEQGIATLTNYGQFLELFPPTHEAQVFENSSWSCAHGVERWRANCGCSTGGLPGWSQAWRRPLRDALDWLRDELAARFEQSTLFRSPWEARDGYIAVLLDRAQAAAFIEAQAGRPLAPEERVAALQLLEMQRNALLMYTSCGWFFDELSGLEPVQILTYAARAIELCAEVTGVDLEASFSERLALAKSNLPEQRDGRRIYERLVMPSAVDLTKVLAHYAITSLFDTYETRTKLRSYEIERLGERRFEAGGTRAIVGEARVQSSITGEAAQLSYGVIHVGGHNLHAAVSAPGEPSVYEALAAELEAAFTAGDLPAVFRAMDRHFGSMPYSIKQLFRDEQGRLIDLLLAPTIAETEQLFQQAYEHNHPIVRFLASTGAPLPRALRAAAELAINRQLGEQLGGPGVSEARVRALLDEARTTGIALDQATLEHRARTTLGALIDRLGAAPDDRGLIEQATRAVRAARLLPFPVDLWRAQNDYHALLERLGAAARQRAAGGDAASVAWLGAFVTLGDELGVRTE